MAAQRGKDFLLKIDQGTPAGVVTVAGLRSRALTFGSTLVDTTNQDSAGQWRELMAAGGLRTARLRAAGVFKDAATDAIMRRAFFDATALRFLVVIPDFGTVAGPFQIVALEFSGRHDGELTFDIDLQSAGEITFTEV